MSVIDYIIRNDRASSWASYGTIVAEEMRHGNLCVKILWNKTGIEEWYNLAIFIIISSWHLESPWSL